MKKLLAGIFGLVLVLAAAIVLLPQVVDWNEYRGEIARRVEALTGREMVIGGDVHVALLPAPALIANDVSISNLPGAVAARMLRLKTLEVRVALGPLLGGAVQVETVKMVDPVIELERLADGRLNWQIAPARQGDGNGVTVPLSGVSQEPAEEGIVPSVRLDNFLIENGTVVFRDSKQGSIHRLDGLNARLAAGSLSGPFDSAGDLIYRGVPLSYEVALGRVVEGRTLPVNMIFEAEPGETKAELSGALLDLADSPRFNGKVVASGDTLSKLVNDLVGPETAPASLEQPFRIETDLTASAEGIETEGLAVSLGPIRATGGARVDFTDPVNVDVHLAANRVDLDALLKAVPTAKTDGDAGQLLDDGLERPVMGEQQKTTDSTSKPGDVSKGAVFTIPENLTGVFDFSVAAVTFSGSNVSEARINAEIAGGEITISQLSALLPGGSDLFATGFLSADGGQPKFDGDIDIKVSDLRRVFRWLRIDPPPVPSDRLHKAAFKGRIIADASQIQGRNLDVSVDSSRLTGAVTLALRKKPAFGANFKIDRLNLDAYLPPDTPASGEKTRPPLETGDGRTTPGKDADIGNPVPALAFLNRFDANLKLQVGRMTYRRVPFNDVLLDGTLFDGNLEIRNAAVGEVMGARGKVSGGLTGLTEIPSLKNVHFEFSGIDAVRLLRSFGVDAPFTSKDVGKVSLTGRADGVLLRPEFDLILKARDTSADLGGRLSILPVEPLFDGEVKIRHADFPQFLRLLGLTYRPAGRLGGVGLSARIKGDPQAVTVEGLSGRIGPVALNGNLTLDRSGTRPKLTAELKTGRIPVDQFLPADGRAAHLLDRYRGVPGLRIIPAAWQGGGGVGSLVRVATPANSIWPNDPIDLSFLQAFDGSLKLNAEAISHEAIPLLGAVADVNVTEGVLRVNSLTGGLFGGQFKGIAGIHSSPVPRVSGSVSLTAADLGAAEQAIAGRRTLSGAVGLRMTLESSGRSVAGLVGGLGGGGSFELTRVALAQKRAGSGLGPIGGLLSGLNDVVGVISGAGRAGRGLADISASFGMANGVARTEDLVFVSNAGTGNGRGDVSLADWRMRVTGDVELSQNLLTLLLGRKGGAVTVPYRIEGPLDSPRTFIDTAKLPGKALNIPGEIIDRSGLGDVLRQINPLKR